MPASLFCKKPVEVHALQWTPDNAVEVINFLGEDFMGLDPDDELGLFIATLEGPMKARLGDWIICGIKGEHYACKPAVFDASYELVCA